MKPIWIKINKAIGIINLIIGLVIFYVIFDFTQKEMDFIQNLSQEHEFPKIETSFLELFLNNQILLLIGILSTISGILILLKKRLGWILSYSFLIIVTLILMPITIYGIRDVTVTVMGPEYWVKIYGGLGLLASFCFLILLSTKPIRIINKINRNSWILCFGIVLIIYLTPRIL